MSSATSSATPSGRRSWQGSSPSAGGRGPVDNPFFPFYYIAASDGTRDPHFFRCGDEFLSLSFSFSLLFGGEKQQQKFSRKPFAIFGLLAENFFFFLCFSVAKSSKSHPTDSDVGVRKADSGVGRLRGFASKPSPPLSLSALRPLFRHRNQVGNRLAEKEKMELRGWLVLRNKSDTQPEAGRTSKLIRASRAHCIIMPPLAAQ